MVGNLVHSVVFLGQFALLIFGSVGYMLMLREKTELGAGRPYPMG